MEGYSFDTNRTLNGIVALDCIREEKGKFFNGSTRAEHEYSREKKYPNEESFYRERLARC